MAYRLSTADLAEPSAVPRSPIAASEGLKSLLAPAHLIPAHDILRDKSLIPDVAGIYGWWFDTPLPNVPLDGTLAIGAHRLLYVGIAPRKPSAAGRISKSTLRRRIVRNHLGSRIGSSTLRRSLAALLREEISFAIFKKARKDTMSLNDEARLTEWMGSHAAVSIMPHNSAWDVEEHLVATNTPALPLNLRGASHGFVAMLKGNRARSANADLR